MNSSNPSRIQAAREEPSSEALSLRIAYDKETLEQAIDWCDGEARKFIALPEFRHVKIGEMFKFLVTQLSNQINRDSENFQTMHFGTAPGAYHLCEATLLIENVRSLDFASLALEHFSPPGGHTRTSTTEAAAYSR